MERVLFRKLQEWKKDERRKPLILKGARQVGKTWLMKEFGRREYQQVAYVNLSDEPMARVYFEGDFEVGRIMRSISSHCSVDVVPGDTLIVLDEIQESERALNALKYLHENAPEYHLMAAGSLLGVALNRQHLSYPVGHVEEVPVHPLSFHEFLLALGESSQEQLLRTVDLEVLPLMHDKLSALLEEYIMVGGMPEVVQAYAVQKSGRTVRYLQKQILSAYEEDFAKYSSRSLIAKLRSIWNSIPSQLARSTGKFTYAGIRQGARGRDYAEAIDWLKMCGLIRPVHRISKPQFPLPSYEETDAFKLYLSDTGLMSALADPQVEDFHTARTRYAEFKGALTEQMICQMLTTSLPWSTLTYWSIPGSMAEVDFVLQYKGQILPIEVKATTNTKSKSLRVYCEKFAPPLAIRTSLAHFGFQDNLLSIPLYMMEDLPGILEQPHMFQEKSTLVPRA